MPSGVPRTRDSVPELFDVALRSRVSKALAEFELCFDAVVAQPSPAALEELREATDQLMRAGARVLFEVSREHVNRH